jgi:hypothetical protein
MMMFDPTRGFVPPVYMIWPPPVDTFCEVGVLKVISGLAKAKLDASVVRVSMMRVRFIDLALSYQH